LTKSLRAPPVSWRVVDTGRPDISDRDVRHRQTHLARDRSPPPAHPGDLATADPAGAPSAAALAGPGPRVGRGGQPARGRAARHASRPADRRTPSRPAGRRLGPDPCEALEDRSCVRSPPSSSPDLLEARRAEAELIALERLGRAREMAHGLGDGSREARAMLMTGVLQMFPDPTGSPQTNRDALQLARASPRDTPGPTTHAPAAATVHGPRSPGRAPARRRRTAPAAATRTSVPRTSGGRRAVDRTASDRARACRGPAARSSTAADERPSAAAATSPTSAGSDTAARFDHQAASGNSSSAPAASRSDSRVLPAPPAPVSVRSRVSASVSCSWASSAWRPTKLVS
jgi:hypothetical protein